MTVESPWDASPQAIPEQQKRVGWRTVACWAAAAILFLSGLVNALAVESWMNERITGAVQIVGSLALVPPLLERLRRAIPIVRPVWVPVLYAVVLCVGSALVGMPFTPSVADQQPMKLLAMKKADQLLREGRPFEALLSLRKFNARRQSDQELASIFGRIDAAMKPAASPSNPEPSPATVASKSAVQQPMQTPASAYAERVETYWLPEVRALPTSAPAADEDFGKLLTQIDALVINIADGANLSLSKEQKTIRSTLISALAEKQRVLLPSMRRRYAKALNDKLFRRDITVTTSGPSAATLRVAGILFSTNANIEDAQRGFSPALERMRFRRVEYRWNRFINDGYDYTLQPLADTKIARWDGTNFSEVP